MGSYHHNWNLSLELSASEGKTEQKMKEFKPDLKPMLKCRNKCYACKFRKRDVSAHTIYCGKNKKEFHLNDSCKLFQHFAEGITK